MPRKSHRPLPDDLRPLDERLRQHRLDPSRAELERVKRQALAQFRASSGKAGLLRTRVAGALTGVVLLAGAGGAVALSSLDSHPNVNGGAADKQYKPPPGCKHHPHKKRCVRPPVAHTGPAHHVTKHSATITGTVNGRHVRTKYYFVWGACPHLNHRIGFGHTSSGKSVSVTLHGLKPGTKYCYEVVATNSRATARGGVRSFRTPRAPSTGHHKTGHHKTGHHQGVFQATHRRRPSRPSHSKKGFTG
jgi:hypothetical protein